MRYLPLIMGYTSAQSQWLLCVRTIWLPTPAEGGRSAQDIQGNSPVGTSQLQPSCSGIVCAAAGAWHDGSGDGNKWLAITILHHSLDFGFRLLAAWQKTEDSHSETINHSESKFHT